MLWRMYPVRSIATSASYYKLGLWELWPGRPSNELLGVLQWIAIGSTACMLVGLWSRVLHAISLVACALLAAMAVSDTPTWSHTDVPPILASVAFLGARGGDAWSIDAWWRRRRGIALPPSTQASARLVQIAVAGVFAIAGYCKIKSGGGLGWALSDNLRNQLLIRFDWTQTPRTAAADWMLAAPWRYQLVAALNLVSQTSQFAAPFLWRRPWLRALLGALFCAEVIGLGVVMDLWDLHWLPLAAAFVDWDRIFPAPVEAPKRGRVWFPTVFVGFFALNAFFLNQRLRTYPFSSFPMFATVRAQKPYSQHLPYDLVGGHIDLVTARPLTDFERAWIDGHGTFRWMWQDRDPARLRRDLQVVLDEMRPGFPSLGITSVRLSLSVYQAPAVPAPARLDRIDVAIIGELDIDGAFRTQLGTSPTGPMLVMRDDEPTLVPYTPPLAGDPVYLITADHWLVKSQSHRNY